MSIITVSHVIDNLNAKADVLLECSISLVEVLIEHYRQIIRQPIDPVAVNLFQALLKIEERDDGAKKDESKELFIEHFLNKRKRGLRTCFTF